jgi:hypothetical protein
MNPNKIVYSGEAQLLSWSNSASSGPKIVLALPDEQSLAAFQRMTLKKGKRAGQRLMLAVVEVGDDEQPVEQEQSGPKRSQIAYLLCEDGDFRRWANANQWEVSVIDHDSARAYICIRCGVDSRSDLDRDAIAAAKFDQLRDEFQAYKDEAFRVGVKS